MKIYKTALISFLMLFALIFSACEFNARTGYVNMEISLSDYEFPASRADEITVTPTAQDNTYQIINKQKPITLKAMVTFCPYDPSHLNFYQGKTSRPVINPTFFTTVKYDAEKGDFTNIKLPHVPYGNYSSVSVQISDVFTLETVELKEENIKYSSWESTGSIRVSSWYSAQKYDDNFMPVGDPYFSIPGTSKINIELEPSPFTVTFYASDNANVPGLTLKALSGQTLTAPDCNTTEEGVTFTDWYVKEINNYYNWSPSEIPNFTDWDAICNGQEAFDFENIPIQGDLELVAKWKQTSNTSTEDSGNEEAEVDSFPSAYSIYYSTTTDDKTTYETVGKTETGDMWYLKHQDWEDKEDPNFEPFTGFIYKKEDTETYYSYKNAGILKKLSESTNTEEYTMQQSAAWDKFSDNWDSLKNALNEPDLNVDDYNSNFDKDPTTGATNYPKVTIDNKEYTIYSCRFGESVSLFGTKVSLFGTSDVTSIFNAIDEYESNYDVDNLYAVAYQMYNTTEDKCYKLPYMTVLNTDQDQITSYELKLGWQGQFKFLKWDAEESIFTDFTCGDEQCPVTWAPSKNLNNYAWLNTNIDGTETYNDPATNEEKAKGPCGYFYYHTGVEGATSISISVTVPESGADNSTEPYTLNITLKP